MCSPYSNESVSKKVQEIWGGMTETGPTCDMEGLNVLEREGVVLFVRRQNVSFL